MGAYVFQDIRRPENLPGDHILVGGPRGHTVYQSGKKCISYIGTDNTDMFGGVGLQAQGLMVADAHRAMFLIAKLSTIIIKKGSWNSSQELLTYSRYLRDG